MKSESNISSETSNISLAVANLPKNNPFCLPKDYFEHFIQTLLGIIHEKEINSPFLLKKEPEPFDIPAAYFETFSGTLMNKINKKSAVELELEELAPTLITLKTENPFQIPLGYFEHLKIPTPSKNVKVVGMFWMKNITKYVAAAALISIAIVSFFWTKFDKSVPLMAMSSQTEKTSELPIEGIISYLDEVDDINVNTENDLILTEENNLLVDLDKETISQVLSEVQDSGISEYIEQDGLPIQKVIN